MNTKNGKQGLREMNGNGIKGEADTGKDKKAEQKERKGMLTKAGKKQ